MDTYTITAIDQNTGYVSVTYSLGGKTYNVTLENMPISDDVALNNALVDYAQKFKAGKDQEAAQAATYKTPPAKVSALVGVAKPLTLQTVTAQTVQGG